MAHKFETSLSDPYSDAAQQIERNVFSTRAGVEAGADEQIYGDLANSIVEALGDIGAQAFRRGVTDVHQLRGLAKAVASVAEQTLLRYRGEVDPEPVFAAIQGDDRFNTLTPEAQDELRREIGKTRQLETLLLNSRRLTDLIDLADSLGLRDHEDALNDAPVFLTGSPDTPSPDTR